MKLSRQLACCLLIGLVALAAVQVQAQELRGRITGVVTDNSGSVVPGVTVTASGPALLQPQTSTTGADGTYRFPALPSGSYTLTYELNGFRTVKREGIRVTLNTTLSVDTTLEVAQLQEALTITGESPAVDVKTTAIGTAFTKELLTDIPNARDVWAAMAQAPGFQMTGYDVGGSHTGTQTGFMTYGVGDQNKTLLEGINVTESTAANAGYFDFGSFEEFQLGGAGNMGEQAGPGALFNLTVKSGGDRFGGEVYFDYEDENTVGENIPAGFKTPGGRVGQFVAPTINVPGTNPPQQVGLLTGNPIVKQYDLNVGFGGPIIKKKLWFFLSYRDNNQYRTILGLPGEEAQSKLENYTAKLTYQLNPKHKFVGFFNQRTKLQPLRDLSIARPVESAHWQASKNRPYKLEWEGVLSDRLYANLQLSQWGNYFPLYPTQTASQDTAGVPIGRIEQSTGQQSGAHSYYHNRITEKPQLSGSLSFFKDNWAGNHSFKLGFEAYRERRTFERFQPGNTYYRDLNGQPSEVLLYNTPNGAIDDSRVISIFLQDGWSLNRRVTLNLGLRYDNYKLGWPAQELTPEQFFPPVSTPITNVASLGSISPRLGLAWDITGKGRTVAKVFAGRYYYNTSTDIGTFQNPISAGGRRHQFGDLNGNRIYDQPAELGRQLATFGGGGATTIDPNLEHAYGNEFSTHLEHEIANSLSARGSYVYKAMRNGWAVVDVERVNSYTIPFTFVDVGEDNIRGNADDRTLQLLDRPATAPTRTVFTNPGNVPGAPSYDGDYHTVEFALNRRMKDKWMLLTSFEHTWSTQFHVTTISTSALAVARQGTPAHSTFPWQPNLRRFGDGREATTFWNYKLLGRYELPWQTALAASFKYQSGFNYARYTAVALPGAGTENVLMDPLNAKRAPNVAILDFRAEKSFKLGGTRKLAFMLDVFNATNADTVTNFRATTGARYNEVIAILDPRMFRFGARLGF